MVVWYRENQCPLKTRIGYVFTIIINVTLINNISYQDIILSSNIKNTINTKKDKYYINSKIRELNN